MPLPQAIGAVSPAPNLQSMPVEIMADILRGIKDWKSVYAAVQSCKSVYEAFCQGLGMADAFLKALLHEPDLIAMGYVHISSKPDGTCATLQNLEGPAEIMNHFSPRWTGADVAKLCYMRRLMIQTRREQFSDLSSGLTWISGVRTPLTDSERRRFAASIFHFMHLQGAFKREYIDIENLPYCPLQHFLFDDPWLSEQVNCVYDFLHAKSQKAIAKVIDEGMLHQNENRHLPVAEWPHIAVAEGIRFVNKLISKAATITEKAALLHSLDLTQRPQLPDMLEQISRARLRPGKNKKLQHYTADECAALFQYPSPEENDGPSMCWLVSHSHTTYSNHSLGFTFRPEFQCLRRVGYVMWDVNE